MMEREQVTAYLAAMPQVIEARPVAVSIGRAIYQGAQYTERLEYVTGMTAVSRGERKAGDTYDREMMFLVGKLPAAYRRSSRTCFRFIGDDRDWFVASYCPADTARDPRFAAFNPFGETFMLAPWQVPDGTAIDHYEPQPYARVGAGLAQ